MLGTLQGVKTALNLLDSVTGIGQANPDRAVVLFNAASISSSFFRSELLDEELTP